MRGKNKGRCWGAGGYLCAAGRAGTLGCVHRSAQQQDGSSHSPWKFLHNSGAVVLAEASGVPGAK